MLEAERAADNAVVRACTPATAVPDLRQFVVDAWHVLEPTTPLDRNWHLDVVSDYCQAAIEDWIAVQIWRQNQQDPVATAIVGQGGPEQAREDAQRLASAEDAPLQRIQNLIVNIPPGTGKSRLISVMLPAWVWLRWPSFRFIFLSSNPRVALRDSQFCRDLIESEWYRDTYKPDWKLRDDANGKSLYRNTAGGSRAAFGFNSRITGDRADAIIWDDPHDADEVHSDKLRQAVLDRWDGAIGNRVNDLRCSLRIGVMQRLHEADLAGHLLSKGGWVHLVLPMEFEPGGVCQCASCVTGSPIGWKDPRTEPGEPLFAKRFTAQVLADERKRLGSAGYAGQMQQRPVPAGGEIFKAHWWRFWVPKGIELPLYSVRMEDGERRECKQETLPDDNEFDDHLQSWDFAFKETKDSDFVAGGVWSKKGTRKYLRDQVRDRMSFTKSVNAILRLSELWPIAKRKLIEGKANGPAVIDAVRGRVTGLVEVEPDGTKVARAHSVTPEIEGGDVYLPHPLLYTVKGFEGYDWVEAFLAEHTAFPFGAKDDQVDQTTQALRRWAATVDLEYMAQVF